MFILILIGVSTDTQHPYLALTTLVIKWDSYDGTGERTYSSMQFTLHCIIAILAKPFVGGSEHRPLNV